MLKSTLLAAALLMSTGCAFKTNSVPWPEYSGVLDEATVDFLRAAPTSRLGSVSASRSDYTSDGQVIALSISGGGARAASYTLGVLSGLENLQVRAPGSSASRSILDMVDFGSSVSGGSWAVAAYLADRTTYQNDPANTEPYSLNARRGHISSLLKKTTRVDRPAQRMERFSNTLGQSISFGDLIVGGIFEPFFNATMMPAQSPFVFSEDYLQHYEVKSIGIHDAPSVDAEGGIGAMPIGLAAMVSGAVPGWFHAIAETSLCESDHLKQGALCSAKPKNSFLNLVDGGLYDNFGTETAFEVLSSVNCREIRCTLIQIDNTVNLRLQTQGDHSAPGLAATARSLSFAHQDAQFFKTFRTRARAQGIVPVLLDLYSTAKISDGAVTDIETKYSALFAHASTMKNWCLEGYRRAWPRDKCRTDDGERNKYWRAGRSYKTTFLADYWAGKTPLEDSGLVTVMWQLGRLAVEANKAEICEAVFTDAALVAQCRDSSFPPA